MEFEAIMPSKRDLRVQVVVIELEVMELLRIFTLLVEAISSLRCVSPELAQCTINYKFIAKVGDVSK